MKKFERPEIEIIDIMVEDVITTSEGATGDGEYGGAEGDD